jgi:uncharacterized protein (DUF1697 family)
MVGLFRGVNVGGAKKLVMADLRALLGELGFAEVGTLLNSGNVVFTSREKDVGSVAAMIEEAVADRLRVSSRLTVLTAAEVATVMRENVLPRTPENPSRLLVQIPSAPSELTKLAPLLDGDWGAEAIAVGTRAVYLWCPDGISKSRLVEEVGRLLRDRVTGRNWSTMSKIAALTGGSG